MKELLLLIISNLKLKNKMKSLYLLTSLAISVLLISCSQEPETKENLSDPIAVSTYIVASSPVQIPISTSGVITSNSEARLSFLNSGIIANMYVEENQKVYKGQVLASLNMTDISAQANQAEEALIKAKRDLDRVAALRKDSAITLEQLQNATTAFEVAEENKKRAQYSVNYSTITSPVNGTVTKKLMNKGEVASAGLPVYIVTGSEETDWVMNIGVNDKDWTQIKTGDSASIFLDAYETKYFSAFVEEIGISADPFTGLFPIRIKLQKSQTPLAAGFVGSVKIFPVAKENKIAVPMSAIVEAQDELGYVFIVDKNRTNVTRKQIKIEKMLSNKTIISGLEEGAEVVIKGASYLYNNCPVIIK